MKWSDAINKIGPLDSSSPADYNDPVHAIEQVTAGTIRFNAVADSWTGRDSGLCNVFPKSLIAIFIPKRY